MSDRVTAPDTHPPNSPMTKWGAARFVVVFLVLTLALLAGGRYAVNTRFMNWYLYQVARQTAFLLGLAGGSASIETPAAYEGRAGTMRAETAAWRRGEEPKPGELGDASAPLTPYEVWMHRALRLAHELDVERSYLAATALPPRDPGAGPSARIARVREDLVRLQAATTRHGAQQDARVAPAEVIEAIGAADRLVGALEIAASMNEMGDANAIANVERLLQSAVEEQNAFLDARVRALTSQIQDKLGPQVTFVAHGGAGPAPQFTFSLVPDCGALPSMSIYVAALIAFPAAMRKRLIGLIAGVPVLYAINLLRLVCLAAIGAYWREDPAVFEFAHQYVWQAVYVLIVVGVWLVWVEVIVRPGTSWQTGPTSAA